MRRVPVAAMTMVAVTALAGCGKGADARDIEAVVRSDTPGVVVASNTACRFDGERMITASGVVKNAGDKEYNVNVEVRFLDEDGVRVEISSDSLSSMERGESAHWDIALYPERASAVVKCEVSTSAS